MTPQAPTGRDRLGCQRAATREGHNVGGVVTEEEEGEEECECLKSNPGSAALLAKYPFEAPPLRGGYRLGAVSMVVARPDSHQ